MWSQTVLGAGRISYRPHSGGWGWQCVVWNQKLSLNFLVNSRWEHDAFQFLLSYIHAFSQQQVPCKWQLSQSWIQDNELCREDPQPRALGIRVILLSLGENQPQVGVTACPLQIDACHPLPHYLVFQHCLFLWPPATCLPLQNPSRTYKDST